jgi:hypothetical protein
MYGGLVHLNVQCICSLVSLLPIAAALLICAAGCAAASEHPRVALLFLTRGTMPLESIWSEWLEGVAGLTPEPLSTTQRAELMEHSEVTRLHQQLLSIGTYSASSRLGNLSCVSNALLRVRFFDMLFARS